MVQRVLTKYGVAFHLAFLGAWVVFSLFARGGGGGGGAAPAWLALIAFEMALLLPTVLRGETFAAARERSHRALFGDPLLYVGLAFLALALVQACNGGCALEYHADADVWRMGDPAAPWLPFAVRAPAALHRAGVLAAVFAAAVIIRRALGRGAKLLLLRLVSSAAGAAGFWFSFRCLCAEGVPDAFWDSAAAQAAGLCFAFWSLVSLGVYFDHAMEQGRGAFFLFLFGVVGNLAGALVFASPAVSVLFLPLFLLLFVSLLVYGGRWMPPSALIKNLAFLLLLAAACVVLFGYLLPGNPVLRKVGLLSDWDSYSRAFTELRPLRAEAAMSVFREHPWFGVGADGFGEFVGLFVGGDAKWASFRQDSFCVLNDYLQLLVEGGVVGAALALFAAVLLAVPLVVRLRGFALAAGLERKGGPEAGSPSPILFSGLAGILLAAAAAGMESPFRAPAAPLSVCIAAAALPAFLPAGAGGGQGKTGRRRARGKRSDEQ